MDTHITRLRRIGENARVARQKCRVKVPGCGHQETIQRIGEGGPRNVASIGDDLERRLRHDVVRRRERVVQVEHDLLDDSREILEVRPANVQRPLPRLVALRVRALPFVEAAVAAGVPPARVCGGTPCPTPCSRCGRLSR